jgi:hypothetical protein
MYCLRTSFGVFSGRMLLTYEHITYWTYQEFLIVLLFEPEHQTLSKRQVVKRQTDKVVDISSFKRLVETT